MVARGLRHILQHAQPLLNRLPALLRQLLPLRQDIITDVLALFRPQPAPHLRALLQFLPLFGWQVLQPSIVFQDPLPLLWTQVVEFRFRRRVRRRRPVRIIIWPHRRLCSIHVRVRRTVHAGVLPLVLHSPCFLLLLSALLPLFLSLLLSRLLWRLIVLSILHPIRARSLRKARHSQRHAHSQGHRQSRELEFPFHCWLHLLILVCVASLIGLHRLRQIRQRREIRQNIKILQHRQVLVYLLDFTRIQRRLRRPRAQPHHRQHQHRRRKRHSRRRREPRPPALRRRLRRHSRPHAHIKRRRRLDHRHLIQQHIHRAKFVHAQLARRARREMLLHLQPFAFLQAPVHIPQNLLFHPATAHDFLPFRPGFFCCLPRCATHL